MKRERKERGKKGKKKGEKCAVKRGKQSRGETRRGDGEDIPGTGSDTDPRIRK